VGDKKVVYFPGGPPGFSNYCYGHKMTVITYKRKFVRMDALGEMDYGKAAHYIKHEGVYMLGGVFGKNASEQRLNDKIYIYPLGVHSSQQKWYEVETTGKIPEGRFHHAMHFYEKGNLLVVFGGRRFANPEPNVVYNSEFVNKVSVLRVDSMEWFEVKYKSGFRSLDSFPQLYNFSSALIED